MTTELKTEIARFKEANKGIDAFAPLIKDMELMCRAMDHVIEARESNEDMTQFQMQELMHQFFMDNQE